MKLEYAKDGTVPALTELAISGDTLELAVARERVILTQFLRQGDLVVYVGSNDRTNMWHRDARPHGTVGIVVSFYRYEDFYGRINNFGHRPGVYEKHGAARILWADGKAENTSAHEIGWLIDYNDKRVSRMADMEYRSVHEHATYIRELPETKFMEYDLVTIPDSDSPAAVFRIESINYHHITEKRNDGSPMPIYDVRAIDGKGGTQCYEDSELNLYQRGDVFHWFTPESAKPIFHTLTAECNFHVALGLIENVQCSETNGYHWPKHKVQAAALAGLIDAIRPDNSGGFLGVRTTMSAIKFTDPDLSARANAALIAGFADSPAPSNL